MTDYNAVDWIEAEMILNDGKSFCLCKTGFSINDPYIRQCFTLDNIDQAFMQYSNNGSHNILAILEYNETVVHFIIEKIDTTSYLFSRHSYIIIAYRNDGSINICVQNQDLKEALTEFTAKVIKMINNKEI